MPHAFKAHPGHPVVPYLVRLHADLGVQIKANQAKAVRLAAMKHVEAVIKLYDPEYSVRSISIRRRVAASRSRRGAVVGALWYRCSLDLLLRVDHRRHPSHLISNQRDGVKAGMSVFAFAGHVGALETVVCGWSCFGAESTLTALAGSMSVLLSAALVSLSLPFEPSSSASSSFDPR